MKKNKIMRIASILLIAVLLSTSIISGTFAKYVTEGSVTDSARVAKFGVVITGEGSLFSETYRNAANGNVPGTANMTIVSRMDDNVVAPGSKNNSGMSIGITGTPEVNVKVDVTITGNEDVFLKSANGLPDMTTSNTTDTFDLAHDYYPIVYTLKQTTSDGTETTITGNLDTITAKLSSFTGYYPANTELAKTLGTFELTWEWAFGGAKTNLNGEGNNFAAKTVDQADTLLGDLAAVKYKDTKDTLGEFTTLVDGVDYNLETSLNLTVTVTQVD